MKTIEEMIAVMTAYKEGKTIEIRKGTSWEEVKVPAWNWVNYKYRVKPEPKWRPYKDAEECFADVQKHGEWVREIKHGLYFAISGIGNRGYAFAGGTIRMYKELMNDYVWADDGSVCGKLEEE